MSPAAAVLAQACAAGMVLEARGDRLAYDAPAVVPSDIMAALREHKAEILELLRRERREFLDLATNPETRAGWLSGAIGTLSPSRVPHRWPAATWPQFIADAKAFCRDWAEKAFLSGWADWELFGCHRRAPWSRIQGMGLVLLLQGKALCALTSTTAVIRTASGARQTYRRRPADPLHPAERCLVCELDTADVTPCSRLRHPDRNLAHVGTTR